MIKFCYVALFACLFFLSSGCETASKKDEARVSQMPLAEAAGPVIPLIEPTPQQATQRVVRSLVKQDVLTIGEDGSGHILYKLIGPIKIGLDGTIYAVDEGVYLGKKFSPEGKLLATYGNGKGQGPGEFRRPFDISIRPDGRVLLLDMGGRKASLFENEGTFIKDIKLGSLRGKTILPFEDTFILNLTSMYTDLFLKVTI